MKRIFLALSIILGGALGLFGLNSATHRARADFAAQDIAWQIQTQRLALIENEHTTLTRQVTGAKREWRELSAQSLAAGSPLAKLARGISLEQLAPEEQEQLRAELGLNWHASDQWLVVSKDTLRHVGLNALKKGQLSDAACGVLAITPEERQAVNTALTQVSDQFTAWAVANLQRGGASGDTVVKYTVPANPEFAAGLTNALFATMTAALGPERTELLTQYSDDWMQIETGYLGAVTNTLTVLRQKRDGGRTELAYKLTRESAGRFGSMQEGPGTIMPKHFPSAFKKIFPGGWSEVAQRDGFELPTE